MRLLHTETLEQCEFYGEQIPAYCILSHTWGAEEITLQDLQERRNTQKAGWDKVRSFVAFAVARGYTWCWIDTCCIDKTSSADLSESINSMFNWYRDAAVCYVYLSDVSPLLSLDDFRRSRWFTRSWTLQELLAPSNVVFVCTDWTCILGDKSTLRDEISRITGIPPDIVTRYPGSTVTLSGDVGYQVIVRQVPCASVAQVMSWAADRSATREEDMAYSLLGLFGLEMPLLYGEGTKAFIRLQHEILKTCTDQTLFAWRDGSASDSSNEKRYQCGLFASSPRMFRHCDYVPMFNHMPNDQKMTEMLSSTLQVVSQRGLQFDGLISLTPKHTSAMKIPMRKRVLRLQCVKNGTTNMQWLDYWWIGVMIDYNAEMMSYVRSWPDVLIEGVLETGNTAWSWEKMTLHFPRGTIPGQSDHLR